MRIKVKSTYGNKLVEPVSHRWLFIHCAGGQPAADPNTFVTEVEPLLRLHGVTEIIYEKEEA